MLTNIFLGLAMVFLIMGTLGLNRLEGILPKLLTSSLLDTMAMILLVIGLLFKTGFNEIGIRLVVVLFFVLLTTPVLNHVMTKATYDSIDKEEDHD